MIGVVVFFVKKIGKKQVQIKPAGENLELPQNSPIFTDIDGYNAHVAKVDDVKTQASITQNQDLKKLEKAKLKQDNNYSDEINSDGFDNIVTFKKKGKAKKSNFSN